MSAFVPPSNEQQIYPLLRPAEQKTYEKMRNAAVNLPSYHDNRVTTAYLGEWLNATYKLDGEIARMEQQQNAALKQDANAKKDPRYVRQMKASFQRERHEKAAAMHRELDGHFLNKVLPQYGEEGAKTWREFAADSNGPGFFGSFFDRKKGEFKLGGILGGLVAGGIALSTGMAGGGLLGIIGAIVAFMVGGWAGDKLGDKINGYAQGPTQSFPGDGKAPSQTPPLPAVEHTLTPRQMHAEARAQALDAGSSAGNHGVMAASNNGYQNPLAAPHGRTMGLQPAGGNGTGNPLDARPYHKTGR